MKTLILAFTILGMSSAMAQYPQSYNPPTTFMPPAYQQTNTYQPGSNAPNRFVPSPGFQPAMPPTVICRQVYGTGNAQFGIPYRLDCR